MNNKFKILVVEDEENIQALLKALLESNNYQVITAETYENAEMLFASFLPDLIMLDLGLPDADGMELLFYIREKSSVPVIVLSARTDENEKVKALDNGANDYVTKPFGSSELLARIRSVLRQYHSRNVNMNSGNVFKVGDLTIDYDKRRVTIANNEIKLTQTEYNIVSLLAESCGKVLTYSSIIKAIWGFPDEGSIKKLQVNMANIRKKFGARPGTNNYILNELGVGYRMNDEI